MCLCVYTHKHKLAREESSAEEVKKGGRVDAEAKLMNERQKDLKKASRQLNRDNGAGKKAGKGLTRV